MPPFAALLLCFALVAWLFSRNRRQWGKESRALWIPLIWLAIVGGRPLSSWLGSNATTTYGSADQYVEGSPVDRAFFIFLIFCGCVVLARRAINWRFFFRNNRLLIFYFTFLLLSCAWSDYPFISFKRWIKDSGNIVMVLIIATDAAPNEAIQSLLARAAYLLVPTSILLNKYYPSLSRYYNRWTFQPSFSGVTSDKNALGMDLLVFAIWSFWQWTESFKTTSPAHRAARFTSGLIFLMSLWLLARAHSSTAIACTAVGCGLLTAVKFDWFRRRVGRLGTYILVGTIVFGTLDSAFDLREVVFNLLGRDASLTGRTDIWKAVLNEDTNPLLGTGFYSFWLGDRIPRLSIAYHYAINEAHNGYLEIYLNNGLIGLALLMAFMLAGFHRAKNNLLAQVNLGSLRLAFVAAGFAYGITEAIYNRLELVWFALLWANIRYADSPDFCMNEVVFPATSATAGLEHDLPVTDVQTEKIFELQAEEPPADSS